MNCPKCKKKAVYLNPNLCREHFISYFEDKVLDTIKRYKMISKNERICVAVSGGKDSLSMLFILNKYFKNVFALAIDEGIKGYRENTLKNVVSFCKGYKINYKIVSFKEEFGSSLDQILKRKKNPCTVCGILRRYLLHKHSTGFDKLSLGHNLDDVGQGVLMNLFKFTFDLMPQLSPISGKSRSFTRRIRPLYFCKEKEVLLYAVLKDIKSGFNECLYVYDSFRNNIRRLLNEYESLHPGTKREIVEKYLSLSFIPKIRKGYCSLCNAPSSANICNACKIIREIKNA